VSPRSLSSAAKAALTFQETGEIYLMLLTIQHPALIPSLYFGNTYLAWPFQVALPEEREDTVPTIQIVIDNIDRRIMAGIRSLPTAPTVLLEVVLASSPDTVEAGPFNFTLRGVDYDALTITGTLSPEDILNEPFPQYTYSPASFPGLFP